MDSDTNLRFQNALSVAEHPVPHLRVVRQQPLPDMNQDSLTSQFYPPVDPQMSALLGQLHSSQLFVVNSRRRNGLILFKRFYAEFVGPGSAVGGRFDLDCLGALPVGNLSLLQPESSDDRQRAYLTRRQWIRLTKSITENDQPPQRVKAILDQFQSFFDQDTIDKIPDEAFALLVGVLPHTVRKVRRLAEEDDD